MPVFINAQAQATLSSDSLFQLAKSAAFTEKNYAHARSLCVAALKKSPNYTDIAVFLGRLYTWEGLRDSARAVLTSAFTKDSSSMNAITALTDLEYWSGNSVPAMKYAELGLKKQPKSEELLVKMIKIEIDLQLFEEARATTEALIALNTPGGEGFYYAEQIKDLTRKNSISVTFDYESFSSTFAPWRSTSASYSRSTPIGTVIGRVNHGYRFEKNGAQFEVDAYPKFSKGYYAYVNAGYSGSSNFPKARYGLSLFASLPYSYEIDAGFRYLQFPSSHTNLYTYALGKYYGSYWFSGRAFIIPQKTGTSFSYIFQTRYYLGDASNYLTLALGTGVAYDERTINKPVDYVLLVSKRASLDYNFSLSKVLELRISAGYSADEISAGNFRRKISTGMSTQFAF